jgi:uncharacterized membrane protein YeaQ/YmgE (transglycosylase-associated protein family)
MSGILAAIFSGFLIGAAARWIVPGPDPMPFWLTVTLGLFSSIVGGGIAAALFGTSHVMTTSGHVFTTLLLEIGVATALVIAYRRFVQRRPVAGPEAHRFPTRGFGIARLRARLQQVGIDPEHLARAGRGPGPKPTPEPPPDTEELDKLRDLHEKGILSDAEFDAARRRLEGERSEDG